MSDLFTEALKDAQKLKEIAEQDAKEQLVEALTPFIRKVIAEEAGGSADFYFEQVEDEDDLDLDPATVQPTDPQGMAGQQPTTAPKPTAAAGQTLSPELGDQPVAPGAAPIQTPESDEVVNASMPDEEGKIVVDFEDLFVDADTDKVTITPSAGEPAGAELPDLGTPTAPGAEATPPAPPPPGEPAQAGAPTQPAPVTAQGEDEDLELPTEGVTYKEYQRVLSSIAEKVDRLYFTGKVTDIHKETIKRRLFDLLEAVDSMRDRGLISGKQARLNENKLEFLFLKLKEASLNNSYFKKNDHKGTDMKTLKEFAAQLFEEDENLAKDSASTGNTGLPVDDEYSKHAADVSGVDPQLGGTKDVEVHQDRHISEADALAGSDKAVEEPWDDAEPMIDEEDQDKVVTCSMNENSADANTGAHDDVAEGAAGFGDTDEEPVAEFEVDDAELAEAVRSIRKENIKKKLAALREAHDDDDASFEVDASEDYPDPGPEGGEDPSHKHLKEMKRKMKLSEREDPSVTDRGAVDDDIGPVDDPDYGPQEAMYEFDMGDEDEDMDMDPADLVLSVDLPPEVEKELAGLGVDDLDVDLELNVGDDFGDEDEEDLDVDDEEDEVEIEVVDDEEDEEDVGSEEEEMLLTDEETVSESRRARHLARKNRLLEAKLRKAARLLEAKNKDVAVLTKQLNETNLFTSRTVYYCKFLQRALTEKALTKKALQQIVEHLDRGQTIAETKAIYTKIKRKLDEHTVASRKLGGSSSKVTKPGSANLNESVTHTRDGQNPDTQSAKRWQVLAGIKREE